MKYIHFIVNPISGKGIHNLSVAYLKGFFPDSEFRIEVEHTQYRQHAKELVAKAIAENPDCIVACGGDGTINEVASLLVGTPIRLGIIPVGSGNGLAANLDIPKRVEEAIEVIKKGNDLEIDAGVINGHYFFSNTGTGIDAMIIKQYDRLKGRTLINYLRATLLSSFKYKPVETHISYKDKTIVVNPLMVFISNSNQMGYSMSLTPLASLQDGWLDLVVIPQLDLLDKLRLGYYVLRNKIGKFKKANHFLINELTIEMPERIFTDLQIDGEHCHIKTNKIGVTIVKKGLTVLVGCNKNTIR